jgi:hypothetical protein
MSGSGGGFLRGQLADLGDQAPHDLMVGGAMGHEGQLVGGVEAQQILWSSGIWVQRQ